MRHRAWTIEETASFLDVGPTALGNARRKGRLRLADLGFESLAVLARSRAAIPDATRKSCNGDRSPQAIRPA